MRKRHEHETTTRHPATPNIPLFQLVELARLPLQLCPVRAQGRLAHVQRLELREQVLLLASELSHTIIEGGGVRWIGGWIDRWIDR